MKECILDHLLADPDISLEESFDLIEFHYKKAPRKTRKEIKGDLEHAFLA